MSHCKDDKWSDDVLQCMTEAKADTDFKGCQAKLTPEQKSSMQQGLKDLMTAGGGGGMAPAGGDGSAAASNATAGRPAAAGSGDGSAAAFAAEHP